MPLTNIIIEAVLTQVLTKSTIQLVSAANIAQLEVEAFLARQGVTMSQAEISALIFGGESTVARSAIDKFRRVALQIISGSANSAWGAGTEARQMEDDDGEQYEWRVESNNPCPDCESRRGQRMSYDAWQAAGLPRSGFSVCGTNCKCTLDRKGSGPLNYTRAKGQT